MRLPFPTHIPLQKAFIFAVALFCVQQLEHTELLFSVLAFAFVIIGTLGFNFAGGFSRPSGAYIFWFVTLAGLVGLVWKAVLGEPAQTNLEMPDLTMAAYDGSVLAMLAAVLLTRRLVRNSKGIGGLLRSDEIDLGQAALGCMAFAVLVIPLGGIVPWSVLAILYRLNLSFPLGIMLGVLYTIRKTQGRHSLTPLTFGAGVYLFLYGGMVSFSKQGLFTPIVCWLIPACVSRFRLRLRHVVVLVTFTFLSFTVLTPLSEVGRGTVPDNFSANQRLVYAFTLVSHPIKLRKDYLGDQSFQGPRDIGMRGGYFDTNQGLFDRLTMMPIDSGLIAYSERGHYLGFSPVIDNMENWFPHFILPNKVNPVNGNYYAHEIGGLLSADDTSTGISFSPASELFHWEGWFGLLVLGPLLWGLLFFVSDFISGDIRVYPWGLILVFIFGHVAPELGIGGAINFVWLGNASVIAVALFSTWIAPILGALFGGQSNPAAEGPLLPVAPPA